MNQKQSFSTALALCVLPSLAMAQTYHELPAGFTGKTDTPYDPYLVPSSTYIPLHLQYSYDTADIPVPVANIVELAWHRNNYYGNVMPAGTITMTITLGLSPNAPSAMSATFASNLVSLVTNVYSGTVSWPNIAKGTGPAPYTHNVLLGTPYLYVAGANKSFVVDIVETATTYTNTTYTIDASMPDVGTRFENGNAQSNCKFSNAKYNNGLSYTTAGLSNNGGTWYVWYSSLLPNAPGYLTLSAFGIDRPGPYTLPIDLTSLGAPGCKWTIGFDAGFFIPVVADANGNARWPNMTVPPGLGGNWFYEQGLFLDPLANSGGIVVTWPSKWYLGTLKGPAANTVYKTVDTASSPTGTLRSGYGTHLRITR